MHFHERKLAYFDSDFSELFLDPVSSWLDANIGPGNGLVPYRQWAITWSNVEPD